MRTRELIYKSARVAVLLLVLISHPSCVVTKQARTATEEAVEEESSAVDVTANDFSTEAKRRVLNGKYVRFLARKTVPRDRDGKDGFILGGDAAEIYIALFSVANQKESRKLFRAEGKRIVVEGTYSNDDASLVDGVHPYGILESARLLQVLP